MLPSCARLAKAIKVRAMFATHYLGADFIERDFGDMPSWMEWREANAAIVGDPSAQNVVAHTRQHGLWEPITRRFFPADQIAWDPDSQRESGLAGGINSRNRAVLFALHRCLGEYSPKSKIYGTEAITPMAALLRGNFPRFIGSEYATSPDVIADLFPIPVEDLTRLSFPDGVFDAVVTTEVLEHVPDLDAALSEMARVLKPGGWHIGTCPFAFVDEKSIVKARLQDGEIIHLTEPEYHGDPMGTGGSLVFEIPGWDILARARAAGFEQAYWKFLISRTFGIAAEITGGVFVLCLQK